jgi:hypothetical protein
LESELFLFLPIVNMLCIIIVIIIIIIVFLILGRTDYINAASLYVKFVVYNLKVSLRRHVYNLHTLFHIPSTNGPLVTTVKLKAK